MAQFVEGVDDVFDLPVDRTARDKTRERKRTRLVLLGKNLFFAGLTYSGMALYAYNVLPLAGLIAVNLLFYIRAYLRMHDLCHAFNTKSWVVRFLPTALYGHPVWGGTAAFITTHVQHHQYLGTNQDPWLNYYIGHPLRALFFNMIEPEHNLYNYIKQGRFDRKLAENLAFDVLRHGLNIFFFQGAYLVHMVVQRTCHGLGVFLFNFWPHRERWTADAAIGSFNREREIAPYAWFFKTFWGAAMTEAGMYHNRHHVVGQMFEPSHRYRVLSDDGGYTRYTPEQAWPLEAVQFLPRGPQGNFG